MKLIQMIPLITLAGATAYGASITVKTDAFVTLSGGGTIPDNTGSVVIGTYGDTDPIFGASPDAVEVQTGFTQLGATRAFEDNSNLANYFWFEHNPITVPTALDDKPVYMIIGNGATLDSSSQFLVWKKTDATGNNHVFTADDGTTIGGPSVITLNNTTGSLFLGNFTSGQFQLVPEPSSMTLLGLGVFALALRRRRR